MTRYNQYKHYKKCAIVSNTERNALLESLRPFMLNQSDIEKYSSFFLTNRHTKQAKTTPKLTLINKNSIIYDSNYAIVKHIYRRQWGVDSCGDNKSHNKKHINQMLDHFIESEKQATDIPISKSSQFYDFQNYKIKFCELIKNNPSCIKQLGLNPDKQYEKLLDKNSSIKKVSDYNFDLDIFVSLMSMMKTNFLFISHRSAFVLMDDFNDNFSIVLYEPDKTIKNYTNSNSLTSIIKSYLDINNTYTDVFAMIDTNKEDFKVILHTIKQSSFIITDFKKPLKSPTYYNVAEMRNISHCLGIIINDSNGKPKTKTILYQEIKSCLIKSKLIC